MIGLVDRPWFTERRGISPPFSLICRQSVYFNDLMEDRKRGKCGAAKQGGVIWYMAFTKYITGLIMLLLIFMLSGCGSNDDHYADNSQSFVTEQSDIVDEKTVISRARGIRDADDYFEHVNTESKLEIKDILDNENEFLVSDEWDVRIIYIYLLSDKGYEKYMFSVNYAEQESVNVHLQDNIAEMYVLCPEYTNVEVLTKSHASSTAEHSLYVIDEEENTGEVGGSSRYRIFDVDTSVGENIEFELCDALESDDYMTYGGFTIQFE